MKQKKKKVQIDAAVQLLIDDAHKRVDERYKLPEFNLPKLLDHLQQLVDQAPDNIVFFIVDLFCGAGGTSEGIEQASIYNEMLKSMDKCAAIIAGVNHDVKAIYSQAINHPLAYYTSEDIRLANIEPIKNLVDILRARFPQCPVIIWSSLECTNHSNAKGGMSRDEDSRTLAWDMNRYIRELDPDGVWIENVKEFEIWGPLIEKEEWINKKGKKVKVQYPPGLPGGESERQYYRERMNAGEIGSCPLTWKFEGKGKKKRLVDWGPTWVTDWRFAGTYYNAWVKEVCEIGYHFQSRILNAADFGAPTNRHRFFVIFMRNGWPIEWPEPTHSKDGGGQDLFSKKKHVAVRTCIQFDVEGRSVFEPGHVESENTWKRLYEGLIKFVAGGKDAFMHQRNGGLSRVYHLEVPARAVTTTGGNQEYVNIHFITKYMGNNQKTGSNPGKSVDEPASTITTQGRLGLVEACKVDKFIMKYYSSHNNTKQNAGQGIDEPCDTVTTRGAGALVDLRFIDVIYGKGYASGLNDPAPTVRTKDGMSLVEPEKAEFLLNYQGQSNANSIEDAAPTLMTKEKLALIGVKYFIYKAYTAGGYHSDIDKPAGAVMPNPKDGVIQIDGWVGTDNYQNKGTSLDEPASAVLASRHWHYIYNPSWFGSNSAIDEPCVTVVASQHKAPLYMASAEQSPVPIMAIPVFESDCETLVKIKEFMVMYDIYDIKKRMLLIPELLKIQSFPENYFLAGTQTDQKRFIGNAVPPKVAKAICEAMFKPTARYILLNLKKVA